MSYPIAPPGAAGSAPSEADAIDTGVPAETPEQPAQETLLDEALEETFPASDPISPMRITR